MILDAPKDGFKPMVRSDSTADQQCATEMLPRMSSDSMERVQPKCAECPPSEVHLTQTGDVKKGLHESELNHMLCQHLHDQKKDQKLDDSKKDQELDDSKKDQELNISVNDKGISALVFVNCSKSHIKSFSICIDNDLKKYCNDELMEKLSRRLLRRGQMLYLGKKYLLKNGHFLETTDCADINWLPDLQAFLHLKANCWRECQHTELPLADGTWLQLVDYPSSWYKPYFEVAFNAVFRIMEEWFSWVECAMPRMSLTTITAQWTYACDRFEEDLVTEMLNVLGTGEVAGNNEDILQVLGETDTEGEGLETVHDEDSNYKQQSLKVQQLCYYITMETLKKPSLEKSEKAILQKAIIDKFLLDVVSNTNPSECHNPSDSNSNVAQNVVVNGAESAPVETQRDHLSVDEGLQKDTSAGVTKESPDMKDLWDKEMSSEDDHMSDKKVAQADAQAEKISSTLETAQKRLPQTDQAVSALTQDQATDVTKSQMTSLKEAEGIVHPQATALPTVHKCPQFTQTLTLPTSQVTVQTVYDPPQSGVLVTAAQMWEAPQAISLPVAQVCTFEAAPKSAPAAVQVGCTFETDLALVPQAPQECAYDVDQGTSVQTGQVFSSHVAECAGDGVIPISKTGSLTQAETSRYTTTYTALSTPDELSHSTASQLSQLAPPEIVIDDEVVQQKCKVDVQPSSHVSDNQSSSEGVHVPQQEEAGNDGAAGDDSVAPDPSTAIPGAMVLNSLSSSMSINARNMVGLPTCTLYTGKTEQQHKKFPTKEDSEERKKKAMDRLRKERAERVKQTTDAVKKTSDACSSSSKASGGVGDSDVSTPTHQTSHAVTKGLVLLSNVPHIFQEGAYVPLPSQEAMAKSIGKGGNGVVAYIYHGGREFAVKETGLRQEELETWSSVNHRNVIEICAVVEGDWDLACPGARRCFQMMPRVTGDLKSLLEEKERPTLCHYFFDFKEDSESAGLVLGNAKYILLGVLNGLKHLHSLGIMHRDIKLQNILVNRHCQCRDIFLCPHDGDSGYGVLISDFDSALQVERGREKLERTKLHGRPIKYSVHGTAGYRPPETSFSMTCNEVLPEWVSLKTDIWSFGTMLVKFFVGSRGPHSQREMATLLLADCLQSPTAAQRPEGVKTDSLRQALAVGPDEMKRLQKIALLEKYFPLATDLHRLVQFCLTVNVEERPTVEQVMEKAFFRPLKQDSH